MHLAVRLIDFVLTSIGFVLAAFGWLLNEPFHQIYSISCCFECDPGAVMSMSFVDRLYSICSCYHYDGQHEDEVFALSYNADMHLSMDDAIVWHLIHVSYATLSAIKMFAFHLKPLNFWLSFFPLDTFSVAHFSFSIFLTHFVDLLDDSFISSIFFSFLFVIYFLRWYTRDRLRQINNIHISILSWACDAWPKNRASATWRNKPHIRLKTFPSHNWMHSIDAVVIVVDTFCSVQRWDSFCV